MEAVIVDYNVGNVGNVGYALERVGYTPLLTSDPQKIASAPLVILPGVGAAAPAMEALKQRDLIGPLQERIANNKLLVGICLGMQLLYTTSYEDGVYSCLDFIPGEIKRFTNVPKIPHMGWNELVFRQEHPIAKNLPEHPYVYFVHSYVKEPRLAEDVIAYAEYEAPVPAITGKGKLLGMQFHPEKSGAIGEQLLINLKECI